MSPRASRYGRYHGGDPLAPPVDLGEALDEIGQDVMAGYSPERAMREFLRRGGRDQAGLDDLARRVAERRRELLRNHHLDGTLQEVRELLDRAVLEERKQLARDVEMDDGDRALREMQLDNLSPSTAAAVSELASYDWQSREAREAYEQIKDLLGRELLDQRFAGMKEALENATDEDRAAVNEMLSDLNDLLEKHQQGDDTQQDFDDFMAKHGQFFPENPAEHRRAARRARAAVRGGAADAELDVARAAAAADGALPAGLRLAGADGAAGPDGRQPAGAAAGRGLGRLGAASRAARGWGSATAPASCRTSPSSTSSPTSSRSPTTARGSTTSTSTRSPASSATARRSTRGPCRSSSGRCATAATCTAAPTASTGSARRRCASSARRCCATWPSGCRAGRASASSARPAPPATCPARPASGRSATPSRGTSPAASATRSAGPSARAATRRAGVRLEIGDVEVQETEARTQAAVALLVDTSFSMAMDGRWVPMKRTALALHTLIRSAGSAATRCS